MNFFAKITAVSVVNWRICIILNETYLVICDISFYSITCSNWQNEFTHIYIILIIFHYFFLILCIFFFWNFVKVAHQRASSWIKGHSDESPSLNKTRNIFCLSLCMFVYLGWINKFWFDLIWFEVFYLQWGFSGTWSFFAPLFQF